MTQAKNHSTQAKEQAQALLALALDAPPAAGPKPDLDEIWAWHQGRLSEPRAGQVKAHVARDPECYRLWSELRSAEAEPAPESEAQPALRRPALFARLQGWLAELSGAWSAGGWAAAVASVLVASFGLRLVLAPDLTGQLDERYAGWDYAALPAVADWPLYRRTGEKSAFPLGAWLAAQRDREARAFRSGMGAGLKVLAGSIRRINDLFYGTTKY